MVWSAREHAPRASTRRRARRARREDVLAPLRPRPRSPAPTPFVASTIAIRSNGTAPRTSRMNAANASSSSSDEPSARAQRFAASRTSTRRPSCVAERLRLGRARLARRSSRRASRSTSQPTISADQQLEPELERDVVDAEVGRREAVRAPATRSRRASGAIAAATASAADACRSAAPPRRRRGTAPARSGVAGLEREDERVGRDDRRCRRRARRARAAASAAAASSRRLSAKMTSAPTAKTPVDDPGRDLVAAAGSAVLSATSSTANGDGAEADPRDPALDVARAARSSPFVDPCERPLRVLAQQRVVALRVRLGELRGARRRRVAERDERVAAQVARVVARDVQALVARAQLLVVGLEPVDERHVRLGVRARARPRGASRSRGSTGRRPGRCRSRRRGRRAPRGTPRGSGPAPASSTRGSASRRACPARRARRSGRRRCRACRSRSRLERRRRLELGVGDERAEHDPRAVAPRDQHRVLAVEADARARGRLAVDVLVLVDEHAVLAAEPPAELVELLAELRVARRTRCSAAAAPAPAAAPARARSSRAPRRRRCARRGAASPGWHETSGCAIVKRMSAKSPRARRSRMCRSVSS